MKTQITRLWSKSILRSIMKLTAFYSTKTEEGEEITASQFSDKSFTIQVENYHGVVNDLMLFFLGDC